MKNFKQMKTSTCNVTIPGSLDYLAPLVSFVHELARQMGFDERELTQIQLGVEEAVVNVITHGLGNNPDESFALICEVNQLDLTIRIREKGVPFDPARMPQYSPEHACEDVAGLGTFLMRAFMDVVAYHNLGRAGRETVLVKRLGNRHINKLIGFSPLPANQETRQGTTVPVYNIRRPRPEESIEISKCAYQSYGYSYMDYIYFPDKINEYNASGEMISAVAVTGDDEIMGHAALKFAHPGARIAEIGVVFVEPRFRRFHLMGELCAFLIHQAEEQKLEGVFAQAVTSHLASQRALLRMGLIECGIALAIASDEFTFKGLGEEVSQRESLVISYLPLFPKDKVRIYPPVRHREKVRAIYQDLGLQFELCEDTVSQQVANGGERLVTAVKHQMLNMAEIRVLTCDEESFAMVRHYWKNYLQAKTDAVFLYLNLEDHRCANFADLCEELGFFFCGLLPGGIGEREAFILQYLNNIKLDYDRINLFSSKAQELLTYIRSYDPNER
jgi:anti-sigma regulatory factor (Ser/Thr protein kinase)/RimJ/RimL family protein N-acetyltransferase